MTEPDQLACFSCGYDLRHTPVDGICPECTEPVAHSVNASALTAHFSQATVATICGAISIIPGFGVVLGPVAVLCYFLARRDVRDGDAPRDSIHRARLGLILGCIGTAINGLLFLFVMFRS